MDAKVECVVKAADLLGECPIWDDARQCLYWVDIKRKTLQGYDPSSGRHWQVPTERAIGSFALCNHAQLLAAGAGGLYWLTPESGALQAICDPEPQATDHRFNDGRCDRQGRFWAGTMCDPRREPVGSLYRIGADLSCSRRRSDITVPNSIAFSPDGKRMYFADTPRQIIWKFDYDGDAGEMRGEEVFVETAGRPDGSAVDAEGCLWNAVYGGAKVVRYRPDGRIDREISVPASSVTCCVFGGRDFDTLYITTARQRLSPEELARQPLAGGLFAVRAGVKGLPEQRFAGAPAMSMKTK